MKIATIVPTRGWVHAACITSVLENLDSVGIVRRPFFQTGLGIPACFNVPIQDQLLTYQPDYIWLVEEDVEVPRGGLEALLMSKADVTAIDYPFPTGYGCVGYFQGKPMWTGTGCTLIRARVFDKYDGIPDPWFRGDIAYEEGEENYWKREGLVKSYGGHDIHFGLTVQKFGFTIGVVPNMTARHWKIKKAGDSGENDGVHQFIVYDHIKHANALKNDPRLALDR